MIFFRHMFYFFISLFALSTTPSLCGELNNKHHTTSQLQFDALSFQMKKIKKSELHLHLGGAWPLAYLKEVSDRQEFTDLCQMLHQIQFAQIDYHDAFRVFGLISKIMNSNERIEQGVTALCKEQAQDNIVYAEFRTGLKDLGSGLEDYLKAVLKGIKQGTAGTSLKVGLILSLQRNMSETIAEKTIDLALKYRSEGVIGIDLSGDSTNGDGKQIFSALIRAKNNHLPVTLHIGESKEETAAQQMLELLTIQPERVGHAVHLCQEGFEWIKNKKIPIELCLTSALKTGMIDDPQEHPALKLLVEGYPVAICTDDPLIFNSTLSQEYALVALHTGLSLETIRQSQEQIKEYFFSSIGQDHFANEKGYKFVNEIPAKPDEQTQKLLSLINNQEQLPLDEAMLKILQSTLLDVPKTVLAAETKRIENVNIPGPNGPIRCRFYFPHVEDILPVFVFFHGGGWAIGTLEDYDCFCQQICHQTSSIVVSIDYHLAPQYKFPKPLEDCYTATQWIAENIHQFGGDCTRLAIGGDSAGGNLAAAVALMAREKQTPQINHQVLIYPVMDHQFNTDSYLRCAEGYGLSKQAMQFLWDNYLRSPQDGLSPYASPLKAASLKDLPSTLMLLANFDVLHDEGFAYAVRLQAEGVPIRLKQYNTIHGFINCGKGFDVAQEAIQEVVQSLRRKNI